MENKITKVEESNKVTESKKRAVTISVTAEQLKELGNDENLLNVVTELMGKSQGGLKGNMAMQIGRAIVRQLELKIK